MLFLLRQMASVLFLPFMVVVVVPFWLHRRDMAQGLALAGGPLWIAGVALGAVALSIGLVLFVTTVLDFARVGRGTLAPWDPPRVLVVKGVYRYVRNPMISGVLFVLLAEVLLTGSRRVLTWLGVFLLVNLVYIPLVEERGLAHRFGERYLVYRQNVPRWVPRFSAWTPTWQDTPKDLA